MMFSIIIPLYNKESRIRIALMSVFAQSFQDYEVIVVNDGSTDKSLEIVESICDSRVRIISQKNGGPSKARNTGAENAKGEWILFLDADDELLPDALHLFSELTYQYPNEKCFACNFFSVLGVNRKIYSIFYSKKVIKKPFWAWNFHVLFPRTGASVMHKTVIEEFKFNNNLRRYEDAEWLFRIMDKYRFVRSASPVLLYNIGSAEASGRRKDIAEDYLGNLDFETNSFGKKLALYQLFIQAKSLYPKEARSLYMNKLSIVDESVLRLLYLATLFCTRGINLFGKIEDIFLHNNSKYKKNVNIKH